MFGECAINVTNSKVKIELDRNEKRQLKKVEVRKQKKIRDLDKSKPKIFPSHHTQIERLIKVIHFYSFSVLYPKKEQKGQKSPN